MELRLPFVSICILPLFLVWMEGGMRHFMYVYIQQHTHMSIYMYICINIFTCVSKFVFTNRCMGAIGAIPLVCSRPGLLQQEGPLTAKPTKIARVRAGGGGVGAENLLKCVLVKYFAHG